MSERPCVFCGRPVVRSKWWHFLVYPSDSCAGKNLASCRDLFIAQEVSKMFDGGSE